MRNNNSSTHDEQRTNSDTPLGDNAQQEFLFYTLTNGRDNFELANIAMTQEQASVTSMLSLKWLHRKATSGVLCKTLTVTIYLTTLVTVSASIYDLSDI